MTTNQPIWKLVANLGDVNPIDYGGYFVYRDETGVYPPEAEMLIEPASMEQGECENDQWKWLIYRFILEPCTFVNGILSDNKFHPELPAWFADSIGSIGNYTGIPLAELVDMLVNGNIESRALAWKAIGEYHGFENLDSYPLTLTRAEVEARYSEELTRK